MTIAHRVHKTCVPEVTQGAVIVSDCAKTRHCGLFQMAYVKLTENVLNVYLPHKANIAVHFFY